MSTPTCLPELTHELLCLAFLTQQGACMSRCMQSSRFLMTHTHCYLLAACCSTSTPSSNSLIIKLQIRGLQVIWPLCFQAVHVCCDAQNSLHVCGSKSLEQCAQANPCLLNPRVLCVRGRTGEEMGSVLVCRVCGHAHDPSKPPEGDDLKHGMFIESRLQARFHSRTS